MSTHTNSLRRELGVNTVMMSDQGNHITALVNRTQSFSGEAAQAWSEENLFITLETAAAVSNKIPF